MNGLNFFASYGGPRPEKLSKITAKRKIYFVSLEFKVSDTKEILIVQPILFIFYLTTRVEFIFKSAVVIFFSPQINDATENNNR